jgi:ACS family hexuronate transporter-like MFS transporter
LPASPLATTLKPPLLAGRWWVASGILLVSVINYLDRQTLSILATTIQRELSLTDIQYGRIVQGFLLAYTLFHLLAGRIVDRLGVRIAETLFIVWWSIANMLTGFATGFLSLALFRTMLGMGEPGHYSASGKAISEWFPAKERAIAVGMLTMGGTLGAAIAAPMVSGLAVNFGWRSVFVITGLLGLMPAALWFALYRTPGQTAQAATSSVPLRKVLAAHPMWLVLIARMITDPLWHFYLYWFPKYLQEVRGFTLTEVGATAWVVYLSADAGSMLGGWLSSRLVAMGHPELRARLLLMSAAAVVIALSFLMPSIPGRFGVLGLASVFTLAEMAWMTNCVTLPIDIFPSKMVGSVQGVIGAGGSLGGFAATGATAYLVTNFGYSPAFWLMGLMHMLAIVMLWLLLPRAAGTWRKNNAI